jgi:hypothetical protein
MHVQIDHVCPYLKQIKEQTGLQVLLDSIYIAGYYVLEAQKRNEFSFVLCLSWCWQRPAG